MTNTDEAIFLTATSLDRGNFVRVLQFALDFRARLRDVADSSFTTLHSSGEVDASPMIHSCNSIHSETLSYHYRSKSISDHS
jgi:hypothetical protein